MRLVNNIFYVADAIYGLYAVKLDTLTVTMVVSPNDVTPPLKFPDDLDITKDGNKIYFSDMSSKYGILSLGYAIIEGKLLYVII